MTQRVLDALAENDEQRTRLEDNLADLRQAREALAETRKTYRIVRSEGRIGQERDRVLKSGMTLAEAQRFLGIARSDWRAYLWVLRVEEETP